MDDDFKPDMDDEGSSSEWLATYGDLVTLLLCFFVLLYSMSTLDNQKFKKAIAAFNSIGILGNAGTIRPNVGDTISDFNIYNAIGIEEIEGANNLGKSPYENEGTGTKEMNYIFTEVKNLVDSKGLIDEIQVEKIDEGVVIRFSDDFLFDIGQADLKGNVRNTLLQLADILRKYDKKVKVEGHTDDVPIKTAKFPSNWELSTARAISVVKYYTEELPKEQRLNPSRLEASGYGEYHPIVPNNSDANRQKNRRVEIIIFQ